MTQSGSIHTALENSDEYDQRERHTGRRSAGKSKAVRALARPTVVFGLLVIAGYASVLARALSGQRTLWLAAPLIAALTYMYCTILHEAVHGAISRSNRSVRWLNEALGYLAAWILMAPLTANRHEHLAHHRHTNDGQADPDFHAGTIRNSLVAAAGAAPIRRSVSNTHADSDLNLRAWQPGLTAASAGR